MADRAGHRAGDRHRRVADAGWLSNSGFGNGWYRRAGQAGVPAARLGCSAWSGPTLYTLLGIAAGVILDEPPSEAPARPRLVLFFVQLALNFAWSPIFFGGAR